MRVTATVSIRAPVARVFDVFTDVAHCAGRITGVKKAEILSEVRSGKGLRWQETRVMFGKDAAVDKEITAIEAPRSYRVESRVDGTNYISTFEFADGAAAGTTVVTWTHFSEALTVGAKFLAPLLVLFQGTMLKFMKKDLADLAEFLEKPA